MLGLRSAFYLLLLPSLVFYNQGTEEKNQDCRFATCRDCTVSRCVWAIYFNGDQNCVASTKSIPGIEAECDDPSQCGKPKCVIPTHNSWDAVGVAQTLGGFLGGLLAGLCGGVGLQNWRVGRRAGYAEIGGQRGTWRNFFQSFLGAFVEGLARRDDEAPLRGDDEVDDQRRQEAARRNQERQMEVERLQQRQEQLRNNEDDAVVIENINPPPLPLPPPENVQPPPENRLQSNVPQQHQHQQEPSFEIRQPSLGIQFGPFNRDESINLPHCSTAPNPPEMNLVQENVGFDGNNDDDGVDEENATARNDTPAGTDGDDSDDGDTESEGQAEGRAGLESDDDNDGEELDGPEGAPAGGGAGFSSDDDDDNDDNNGNDLSGADAGPLPEQNFIRQPSRAASINAAKLIASLRINKQI